MKGRATRGMDRLVRRVAVSGVVTTAVSWALATAAHAGFIDNHNQTLVDMDPPARNAGWAG